MAYTKEQITKIIEATAKEFTKNSYLMVNKELLTEKLTSILESLNNLKNLSADAFDTEIKAQYKEMYKSLFESALDNEMANPAKKRIEKEVTGNSKSLEEKTRAVEFIREHGVNEEAEEMLKGFNAVDVSWIEASYLKGIQNDNPEMQSLLKKRHELNVKLDKLDELDEMSESQQRKEAEYNERVDEITGELLEMDCYKEMKDAKDKLMDILGDKAREKEAMENAAASGMNTAFRHFEGMMKHVWNTFLADGMKSEDKTCPLYGGLTEDDAREISGKYYTSMFQEHERTHRVAETGKIITQVKKALGEYTPEMAKNEEQNYLDRFGAAYKTLEINFRNRGFFGKLFHLSEYFTAKNIRSILEEGTGKTSEEVKALLEESAMKSQSKRTVRFTNSCDALRFAIEDKTFVDTAPYQNATKSITGEVKPLNEIIEDDASKKDDEIEKFREDDEIEEEMNLSRE